MIDGTNELNNLSNTQNSLKADSNGEIIAQATIGGASELYGLSNTQKSEEVD